MPVHHITSLDNVDESGYLRDNSLVRHGSVEGGVIADLAGPVDPLTHNNLDFPNHETGVCAVAEKMQKGSPVARDEEGLFARARPRPGSKERLGRVNLGARRVAWLQQFGE